MIRIMIEHEVHGEFNDQDFDKAHRLFKALNKTETGHVWISFSN